MNRYARSIIVEFKSDENKEYLRAALCDYFNNPKVFRYLEDHLADIMDNFAVTIEQELSHSDPMPGVTIMDQLTCFNNQFIDNCVDFIQTHVMQARVPLYVVKDGLPTSRKGLKHYQMRPNDILKTWLGNSGRGVQAREDAAAGSNNPFDGSDNGHMETGIVFCDQSDIGTQNHVEQYENTIYKHNLNKEYMPHESTVFGVSTIAADARLLNRRIFRKNTAGVENGIPRYESRLYNRHLERNISEGLHNAEHGCMVHGYDMDSIKRRTAYHQRAQVKYQMGCDQQSQLKLQYNNSHADDLRYC